MNEEIIHQLLVRLKRLEDQFERTKIIEYPVGGGGGAPTDAQYVVMALNGTLTQDRRLQVGSPLTLADGGANGDVTLDFDETIALGNNARITIRKNTGADVGTRRRINLIEGSNITLTVSDDAGSEEIDVTIAAAGGGGAGNTGTAILNFGAFPGTSDASVDVTGQTSIVAGSIVEAWIRPIATVDHSADEHMLETLKVFAANIVAGVGFTIYGFNSSEVNEGLSPGGAGKTGGLAVAGASANDGANRIGGIGTFLYGQWTVAWRWS